MVLRRYNDFVAFQEVLLLRYPYRMIPRLPPKKLMGGMEFSVPNMLTLLSDWKLALHSVMFICFDLSFKVRCQKSVIYILADREFIELRRRSLKRFLVLVVRHPVLVEDRITKYFLTFSGSVCNSWTIIAVK